jgi:hypothetical protein
VARLLFSHKQQVSINSQMFALDANQQPGLGSPLSTGGAQQSAWLLSPEELKDFQKRLRATAGVTRMSSPRVQTFDGGQAQVFQGSTMSVASNLPVSIGLTLCVLPKLKGTAFRLLTTLTASEALSEGTNIIVRTNISAACRAVVPNGGGLVLASAATRSSGATNYLFVLSVMAVDAKGNPSEVGR